MKIIAVGGHSRDIGKTSLACSLIAAAPELNWTAVKIAQFGHGVCSQNGKPCGCSVDDPEHPFSVDEETETGARGDTRRMLAVGARRAFWVRAPQGGLGQAMPAFQEAIRGAEHVIVESNTVLDFLTPDFYVVTLDFRVEDFKPSCRRHLRRADAFAVVRSDRPPWEWFDHTLLERKPSFEVTPPEYCTDELAALMRGACESPPQPVRATFS